MPNGFTDRQIEELNRVAAVLVKTHDEALAELLPSLAMRQSAGETIQLFEIVDANLSRMRPIHLRDAKVLGGQYKAVAAEWQTLKRDALKQAKTKR